MTQKKKLNRFEVNHICIIVHVCLAQELENWRTNLKETNRLSRYKTTKINMMDSWEIVGERLKHFSTFENVYQSLVPVGTAHFDHMYTVHL